MKKDIELSMYEKLLQLPLFQGMGRSDMEWIIEKIRFSFSKYKAGQTIIKQDTPCDSLIFILNGETEAETWDNGKQYAFCESLPSPTLLQPEVLFGPQTRYISSVIAVTDVSAVSVSKSDFWQNLIQYEVFRLNFINLLSAQAQYGHKLIWRSSGGNLTHRIIRFFLLHSIRPAGRKVLKIKMEDLASQLGETRINVSKTLNDLKDEQLVQLKRSTIEIPRLELLIPLLNL